MKFYLTTFFHPQKWCHTFLAALFYYMIIILLILLFFVIVIIIIISAFFDGIFTRVMGLFFVFFFRLELLSNYVEQLGYSS